VQRLARGEIEPAPPALSEAGICRFDYLRDVSIVAIHISLSQADGGGGNRTRVLRMLRHRRRRARIPVRTNQVIPAQMSRTNLDRSGSERRAVQRGGVRRR
jgi:hypothetical protein